MSILKKIIGQKIVNTYLRVMGGLTGLLGLLLALFPSLGETGEDVVAFALYLPPTAVTGAGAELDYSPLIQHWGLLLALVGVFMIAASVKEEWVVPAMAISGIEKLFIVVLSVFVYDNGFVKDPGVAVDSFGTLFSLLYFAVLLSGDPGRPEPLD